MKTRTAVIALALVLIASGTALGTAWATVVRVGRKDPMPIPSVVAYQGLLTTPDGHAVQDGSYQVTFRLYGAPTGGTALWSETQAVITRNGIFNASLGSVDPFPADLFQTSPLYLALQLQGQQEMTPRESLASVPFAFRAANADTVGGFGAKDLAKSNQSCPTGQAVTGIDANGGLVCAQVAIAPATATPVPTSTIQPSPAASPTSSPTPTPVASSSVATITVVDNVGDAGRWASLVMRNDGTPFITYQKTGPVPITVDGQQLQMSDVSDIYGASCNDGSCTAADVFPLAGCPGTSTSLYIANLQNFTASSTAPIPSGCSSSSGLLQPTNPALEPTLASGPLAGVLRPDGTPAFLYLASQAGPFGSSYAIQFQPCEQASCQVTASSTGLAGVYGPPVSYAMAIGSDGLPVASYHEASNGYQNGYLKVAHCENAACSDVTRNTVVSTGDIGAENSIAIGSDGLPIIAYYYWDGNTGSLTESHCNDVRCSSASNNRLDTMDPQGLLSPNVELQLPTGAVDEQIGGVTSIAVGHDGLAVIAYYAFDGSGHGELKVAHCQNVRCNSADVNVVDASGNAGMYNSIAIGADGFPIISYYDIAHEHLKVAHCENATCSRSTVSVVDPQAGAGLFTSIGVEPNGKPVVAYYDAVDKALRVAQCRNATCGSGANPAASPTPFLSPIVIPTISFPIQ